MRYIYPFTAIVGQELMKKALILNVIDPTIGGVLLRGEKGTGKSLAVRALSEILPEVEVVKGCPFSCDPKGELCDLCREKVEGGERLEVAKKKVEIVELPLGATEDRVVGTIDIEAAIKEGKKRFEPGVLAKANRNILYIDEVNLLEDHIVDLLLDVAAMGVNYVEREGVSFKHPSRFILVGTMNPEEGELRPQLLDRFGLSVEVKSSKDPEERKEIIKRRIAFEKNPQAFLRSWEEEQISLKSRIERAKSILNSVAVRDEILDLISRICIDFGVDGHRADITIYKTSVAIAAFKGKKEVDEEDVKEAAELALPHRRRKGPFDEPRGGGERKINLSPNAFCKTEEKVFKPGEPFKVNTIEFPSDVEEPRAGRRSKILSCYRGRYVRSGIPKGKPKSIALDATIRAACSKGRALDGRIVVTPADVREKVRERKAGTLIVFVIDASGSMAAQRRMVEAKKAVLSLLLDAYQRRDKVSMIAFRGKKAELLLPPTGSVEFARKCLERLPTGGRTPMAHGLIKAVELIENHRRKDKTIPFLVLISDGRPNVGMWGNPLDDARLVARLVKKAGIKSMVLDTDESPVALGFSERISREMGAIYLKVPELNSQLITKCIRERTC